MVRRELPIGSFGRNVSTTFVAQILGVVGAFLQILLVARYLGPSGAGVFAVSVTVPRLVAAMFGAGSGASAAYFVAHRDRPQVSALTAVVALAGSLAAILLLVALWTGGLLPSWVPGMDEATFVAILLGIPAYVLAEHWSGLLLGMDDVAFANASRGLAPIVGAGLMAVALPLAPISVSAVASWSAGYAAAVAVQAPRVKRLGWHRPDDGLVSPYLRYGFTSAVGSLAQLANYRLDIVLVSALAGTSAAGIYAVATRAAEGLLILPNAVSFALFGAVARDHRAGAARTSAALKLTLGLTLFGGIVLGLAAPQLLPFVFGEEFVPAVAVLRVLLIGMLALAGTKVLAHHLSAVGRPSYNVAASGGALVVTLTLDVLLIPALGTMGAATASTAAYTTSMLVVSWAYLRLARSSSASSSPS